MLCMRIERNIALRTLAVMLAILCITTIAGCVERTISITSQPSGALVYLNDQEVGRTPLSVPFTYYGHYNVRLEHDNYLPLSTTQHAKAPWWEAPGPDLIAEMIPNNHVELSWHFNMDLAPAANADRVIDHANQLRALLRKESPELDTAVTETQPAAATRQ